MSSTQKVREDIAEGLKNQPNVSDVALRKMFGGRQTDISVQVNGSPVAIQLVYSHLTEAEVRARTTHFNAYGLSVMWVFPFPLSGRFYTKKTYRFCHAAFYGRVYCHHVGQLVFPVRFEPAFTYIVERKWRKDGNVYLGGGYKKTLKRIKTAVAEDAISIAQDFRVLQKAAWSNDKIQIPKCSLFINKNLTSEGLA